MSYKALYRTYRPSTFDEVAGQSHIVKTLRNALTTNKIAHAYLFCGPRGTGKTTMAKLFAKALNCEEGIGCQCNACSNCLAIKDGSHPDVIEIDAASNNGVEDVRDIIERVKYSPIKGKYKVYIIDEVHMMSPNAFNALLKTLEEPPANVIFILATTEPHKVLPTILSRCQRYDFSKVDDASIKDRMETILRQENITYDPKALNLIISLADGGMRDALSLLDQAIAYCGTNIEEKDIEDIFGLISIEEIISLIVKISNGDVDYVINKTSQLIEHGSDIRHLTQDLLDVCKDIVIYNKLGSDDFLVRLNKNQAQQLCKSISSITALNMIEILMKAQAEFKAVSNIKTLFEVTLLKLTISNNSSTDKVEHQEVVAEKHEEKIEEEESVRENQEAQVEDELVKEENISEPIEDVVEKPQYVQESLIEEDPVQEETIELEEDSQQYEEKIEESTSSHIEESYNDDILQSDDLPPFMEPEPTSLFEEEEKNIVVPSMQIVGEQNVISDDDIIRLMVLGNKAAKKALNEKWPNLQDYIMNSKYNLYAGLLRNGTPFIFTKEILVLTYETEREAKKANIKQNQQSLQDVVEKIYGRRVRVYGLHRKKAVELYTRFSKMYEVNKLPKAETISIKFDF